MNNNSVTVGVLGPEGSYSQEAAMQYFGKCIVNSEYLSPQAVIRDVSLSGINYGVVPVENSIQGGVYSTLDALLASDVRIAGEVVLPVSHVLACHADAIAFRRVLSHEQALEQCRDYLNAEYPGCVLEQTASTSHAAMIAGEGLLDALVVCSRYAAGLYGLRVIAEDIASSNNNETRFLVVGNGLTEPTGNDKTSIVISLVDKPGALYQALGVFYKHGINLTWVLSRPTKKKLGEYVFPVDFEGHVDDMVVKSALRELKEYATDIRVLGSYPKSIKKTSCSDGVR